MRLIASGSVEIRKARSQNSEKIVITRVGAGGLIGEMSLIDGMPRSATAVTIELPHFII